MALQRMQMFARSCFPDPDSCVSRWYCQLELMIWTGRFLSLQQLAIICPSGEKRTEATPFRCPFSTISSLYGSYCGGRTGGVRGVAMGELSLEYGGGLGLWLAIFSFGRLDSLLKLARKGRRKKVGVV